MREKLATLPLTQLKELAKSQGIKNISGLRKAELIDRLCETAEGADSKKAAAGNSENRESTAVPAQGTAVEAAASGNGFGSARTESAAPERASAASERADRQEHTGRQERTERYERSDRQDRGERQMRNDRQGGYQSRQNNYRERQNNYQDRQSGSYQDRQNSQNSQSAGQDAQTQGTSYQDRQSQNSVQDAQGIQESTRTYQAGYQTRNQGTQSYTADPKNDLQDLDSGIEANGILEVMPDGFGFIRCENFLPGDNDVYVAPSQIRRFNMKTGDIIRGSRRVKSATEKFAALLYVKTINGYPTSVVERRPNFEDLTPIFPNQRLNLEVRGGKNTTAMRVMDLLAPIGKGQRGLIVSPPKAGKTTLLKSILGMIKPLDGFAQLGDYLYIGYFEQESSQDNTKTCIEEIWEEFPSYTQYEVRSALAKCGLTTKHIESQVRVLSGGEQAKVRLCKLINRETNLLVLDEPTNHLDADAKAKRALKDYKGSILMVCHEPEFYEGLATGVWDCSAWSTKRG